MSNNVVNYYENYKEEDRITKLNSKKVEFLTTIHEFERIFPEKQKILDCAAGTGVYSFYLVDKGHDVYATDITPRHIDYINNQLKNESADIKTAVMDAADMKFGDNEFDIVLNMGPFYHLCEDEKRVKCFEESLRVLKSGGLLAVSYIPRLFINQMLAVSDTKYLNMELLNKIRSTGVLKSDDPMCFWTDTYYSSYDEMSALFEQYGLEIVSHFAQDGLTPLFNKKVNSWNDDEYKTWLEYHMLVCKEKNIIDMSNHVLIIGRKK